MRCPHCQNLADLMHFACFSLSWYPHANGMGIWTCVIWFVTTLATYAFDGVTLKLIYIQCIAVWICRKKNPCLIARRLWSCFPKAKIWRLCKQREYMYLRIFASFYIPNTFPANIHSNLELGWQQIRFCVNFNDISSGDCIKFKQAKCI